MEDVGFTAPLGVVFDTGAPDLGAAELLGERLVDSVTEVEHAALGARNNDGRIVVRDLSLGLCVDSDQVQVVPDLGHQVVKVPFVLSTDGHVVRELVEQVKLLNRDSVNLVEDIDAWDIDAIAFNDIDKVIHGVVFLELNVAVGNPVLVQDSTNGVVRHLGHLAAVRLRNVNSTTILSLESDLRRLLVQADSETFQFTLD